MKTADELESWRAEAFRQVEKSERSSSMAAWLACSSWVCSPNTRLRISCEEILKKEERKKDCQEESARGTKGR
jgi:hypothetical protein